MLRPEEGNEDDISAQKSYFEGLKNGSLSKEGFKVEWSNQIEVMEGYDAVGISSTNARDAASQNDWSSLERMIPKEVCSWIREHDLY